MPSSHSLLTVREVSDRLGLRRHAVLALIRCGELRGIDVSLTPGGRPRWRIDPDEMEAFVTRRTHAPQRSQRRKQRARNVKKYF